MEEKSEEHLPYPQAPASEGRDDTDSTATVLGDDPAPTTTAGGNVSKANNWSLKIGRAHV